MATQRRLRSLQCNFNVATLRGGLSHATVLAQACTHALINSRLKDIIWLSRYQTNLDRNLQTDQPNQQGQTLEKVKPKKKKKFFCTFLLCHHTCTTTALISPSKSRSVKHRFSSQSLVLTAFLLSCFFSFSTKLIQGCNNAILHGIKHLNLHHYLKVMNMKPEGHQPSDLPARTQEIKLEGMICTANIIF